MNVDPNSVDSDGNTPLHIIFNLFSKDPIKAHLISHALLHF